MRIFSLFILFLVGACSNHPLELSRLSGNYSTPPGLSPSASLAIYPNKTYRFCSVECETGEFVLWSPSKGSYNIIFKGTLIEKYYRELFSRTVGDEAARKTFGPLEGSLDTEIDFSENRVKILIDPLNYYYIEHE